jgi:hypothetical protein
VPTPSGAGCVHHASICRVDDAAAGRGVAVAAARTDESGCRLYASVLSFFDALPSGLALMHEQLLGARASKALCLLSTQPYLTSMEQVCVGGRGAGGPCRCTQRWL